MLEWIKKVEGISCKSVFVFKVTIFRGFLFTDVDPPQFHSQQNFKKRKMGKLLL